MFEMMKENTKKKEEILKEKLYLRAKKSGDKNMRVEKESS